MLHANGDARAGSESPVMAAGHMPLLACAAEPLSQSPLLPALSRHAATLGRLFGRGPLSIGISGAKWRFRWRHLTGPMAGVELRLRIGNAEATVGLEDLAPFGAAADVARPELPAGLRAAYLNGLGAAVWRELEAITTCAIEVLEIQPHCSMRITPDCLGFELRREPTGAGTRGFLRPDDSDNLRRVLLEASQRGMASASPPRQLPIRWVAIIGSTRLTAAEARALEPQDIVVIGDAAYTAEGLGCRLCAAADRRHCGRALLLRGGQLQIIDFTTIGNAAMTDPETDAASTELVRFQEIPIILRFELPQWNASLAEMANLSAGSVIDLGQRIDEQSVSVWVEQRCVGRGQLVAIGERLGVRLLSVFAENDA
jgi:type III secretion protein Q